MLEFAGGIQVGRELHEFREDEAAFVVSCFSNLINKKFFTKTIRFKLECDIFQIFKMTEFYTH